jgi:hypothetical protein
VRRLAPRADLTSALRGAAAWTSLGRMADSEGDEIAALCRLASQALRGRGHMMGEWGTDSADRAIARTAVCERCGLSAHVRAEGGLRGIAGPALTSRCTPHRDLQSA